MLILGGKRVLLALIEVLDGDQASELAVIVDERELLDAMLGEGGDDIVRADPDGSRDETLAGHDVLDEGGLALEARHEPHVAVGDDADERPVVVDDGEARDAVGRAHRVDLFDRGVGSRGHGVGDHARLAALDAVDLRCLIFDREVPVQDAEASLSGDRDRHPRLGDGVHRAGNERDRNGDAARHPR